MKALLIILCLAFTVSAQQWQPIKEMSGEIPNHPGLTMETFATQIARGEDYVKLSIRFDFPGGAPMDLFKIPQSSFDVSSISQVVAHIKYDCRTRTVTTYDRSADIYRFNGQKLKSKEPPFQIPQAHVFAQYFCEQPSVNDSTKLPTLKRPN